MRFIAIHHETFRCTGKGWIAALCPLVLSPAVVGEITGSSILLTTILEQARV